MMMVRTTGYRAAGVSAGLFLVLATVFTFEGGAEAAIYAHAALPCSASISKAHPTQYSTVFVTVRTRGRAGVTTTAHYRTSSTTRSVTASSSGVGTISYRISRVTIGYRVVVSVAVRLGNSRGTCSTSFTPI
jgi:hypothetical protein